MQFNLIDHKSILLKIAFKFLHPFKQKLLYGSESMKNIIVVECRSTGTNYIADIKNRNYNPVVSFSS